MTLSFRPYLCRIEWVETVMTTRQLISNGNPMEEIVGFSRAVRVGAFIAVGGTAPVNAEGQTVGIGDVFAQTRQCFEIIKSALEEAGSGLQDIVRTRVILTDIDRWKEAIDARKLYCREARPVDTIMAIDRFVNPEWLVEIEVDAIVPEPLS
ncbi:RidA family protein [Gymnodinialimonas ceratoperidinii]|nr:RidA family protein [Gymnodinialimonas ceratoperidinii]